MKPIAMRFVALILLVMPLWAAAATITPDPLGFTVRAGETASLPVQISNPTASAVAWKLEVLDSSGKTDTLESLLGSIDASGTALNGPLPSRYDFTEGETGTSIATGVASGSTQIFNQGNKLTTNLGGPLAYSNGAVASSALLGSGGRYFTRKLPGLFVFAADVNGISWFEVAGSIYYGSSRQTSEFTVTRNGRSWSAFVAKTSDYWRTINHLVLVDQTGLTQTTATSATDEKHRISGLSGKHRLYHLLFVTSTTTAQPDSVFLDLANRLLDSGPGVISTAVSVNPASGTAPASGVSAVTATANAFGLAPGTFSGSLAARTPAGTLLDTVPVTLEVTAPRLVLPATINHSAVKGMIATIVNTPATSSLPEAQTWSASLPGAPAWLSLVAASGTTPEPLGLRFTPGSLAAGTYWATVRIVCGAATFEVPVSFRIDELAVAKFLPDPARPVIYAINKNAKEQGSLLVIDALSHQITRVIPVGKEPSDLDLTDDGTQLVVINTTEPSLSRVSLDTFTVTETIPLTDFSNRNEDFGGHVKCGKGSIIYYVDEQWGPRLRVLNAATRTVLQTFGAESGTTPNTGNDYGYGDIALSPDRSKLFGWRQYGDGAGVGGTHVARFTINTDGTLSGFAKSNSYGSANFDREPFNTPVLFTRDGSRMIIKDRVVGQTDLNNHSLVYPDEIYSIAPGGEIAAGTNAIYAGQGGEILYTLPLAAPVQAILPDYSAMVYFNTTSKTMAWLDLIATLGTGPLGLKIQPADGATVVQPNQLRWLPVTGILHYQVYLGTSRAAVESATPASATYLGETTNNWLDLSSPLAVGQAYYWRVVPVNASGQAAGAGVVYAFTVSNLSLSRSSITAETVAGASRHEESITMQAPSPQAWSASSNVAWINSVTASGTTPGTLVANIDASALAAGYYQGNITLTSGGAAITIPVSLRVYAANFMIAKADLELPYVYVISQESNTSTQTSFLLRINTATDQIEAAIPCGRSVTDLAIHYAENRIYLTNWQTGILRAFDRSTFSQVQTYQFAPVGSTGYGEGGIWRLSAGKAGRLILEESDQWIDIRLIDTANGAVLATNKSSIYAGDGEADPTGRYYYHSESLSSSGSLTRYDLAADTFAVMAPTATGSAGTVVMIPDGSKVAVGTLIFNAQLGLQYTLPSTVLAGTLHGDLLFTSTKAYNGANGLEMATLPVTSSVMSVTGDQKKLYIFPASTKTFRVVTLSTIATLPSRALTPTLADGTTVIGTNQQLGWSIEPTAMSYRVFFGTDRDAVADATTTSPEYLGPTQSSTWTGTLPALALDGNYYWRVDTIGYSGANKGTVWSFNIAPLVATPKSLDLTLPVSAPVESRTLAITGPAGTPWSASTSTPWLSLPVSSGSTPGSLEVRVNPSGLAAGIYQGSVRFQSGTDTWTLPVSLELLTLNYILAEADLGAPYIYAIAQAASGTDDRAFMVVINTLTNAVSRVVPVGRSVTDLAIHYAENRIYLTNWKSGVLRAFDRSTFAEVQTYQFTPLGPTGYGEGGIWRVSAGKSGRLILEESDQWIDIRLIDTANGAVLATNKSSIYAGDGEADPTGRYYYHAEGTSSNKVTRFDLAADTFVTMTPLGSASSANVVMIPDGSKVAVGTKVFDAQLGLQSTLVTAVAAATVHGELLFTNKSAVNGVNAQILATLPVDTAIQAVSADQKKLYQFKAGAFTVVDIAAIAVLPSRGLVPGIADAATVIGTAQELSWLQEPAALSYDVYFGTSAAAVTAATKTSAEFLGNVTGIRWTGNLPTLALGSSYYWRVDVNGFSNVTRGSTWSFQIAAVDVTPRSVTLASPASAPVPRQALSLTSEAPIVWSASTTTPWLTLRSASGTTPATLEFDITTTGMTVGAKTGSITLQAAGQTFSVPVNLSIVTLNVTQLIAHPSRAVVYGINTALTGEGFSHLLEIDAATAAIRRTLPIGFAPTDADLDPVNGRLYISNWGYSQTRVIDVDNWVELPSLNLGTDVYKLEITPNGKLVTEGEDQWVSLKLWNAATGTSLTSATSSIREGDGQADPTGNFYYHCDNNSSGAIVAKYDISNNTFVQVIAGPQIGYGSRNLILSEDGARLFWLGRVLDADLHTLAQMPAEVYATNRSGDLAVGTNLIWWSDSATQVATLPFDSTVAAVSANDAYLVRFNATAKTLHSTAVATLTDLPGPWPRPGQVVAQSPQRLSWSPVAGATAYRVFLASDATALATMTTPVATVTTTYYDLPSPLAFGRFYTWRADAVTGGGITTGKVQSFGIRFPQGPALPMFGTGSAGIAASMADRNLLIGINGSAQLYQFDYLTGIASPLQSFTLPGYYSDHQFGTAVAVDAGKAAVGAYAFDTPVTDGGAAYVYRPGTSGYWESSGALAPPSLLANEAFGMGLAASGNLMLVGTGNTYSTKGRVTAYVTEPAAVQVQTFSAGDGVAGDGFGYRIAMDGNQAIISAPGRGTSYTRIGCLYAFSRSTATGLWAQTQKIAIAGATSSGNSGNALALSGTTLATISDSGAVLVYTKDGAGQWLQSASISRTGVAGSSTAFGSGLALLGNQLFIGDTGATYAGTSGGAVFSFLRSGTAWVAGPVITPTSTGYSSFGKALAARDGWLLAAGGSTQPAWLFRVDATANHTPRFVPGLPSQVVAGRTFSTAIRAEDADGNAGLAVDLLGKPAWLSLTDGGNGNAVLSGTPAGASGDVSEVQLRVRDGVGGQALYTYRLTTLAPTDLPTLTLEPLGGDLGEGQELTLRAAVSGIGPFQWQWYRDGEPISGATGAKLTIQELALADAGRYSVRVANVVGEDVSAATTVTVHAANRYAGDWTTFGSSPAHNGRHPAALDGFSFVPAWNQTAQAGTALNRAALSNGRVFVVPQSRFASGISVKAFDLTTGTPRWSFPVPSSNSTNPPTVYNGRVYFQRCKGTSDSPQLICLNADTGAQVWASGFDAQWGSYEAPAVNDQGIFINGGYYGGMYGFNPDGSQRFFQSMAQYDDWTPTLANDRLFSWVEGVFKEHNPADGTTLWSVDAGWNWNGWSMNTVAAVAGNSAVVYNNLAAVCIDLPSRSIRWRQTGTFTGSFAMGAGRVYAIQGTAVRSYALADGTPGPVFQTTSTTSDLIDQAIVLNDRLLISNAAKTWIFNLADARLLQTLNAGGRLSYSNSYLLAAGNDGVLRAFIALSNNPRLADLGLSAGTMLPEFATLTTSYIATVPFATDGVTVTPVTEHPAASVQVNGTAAASGAASALVRLAVGTNPLTTLVTAEDGIDTMSYTITVTRLPDNFVFSSASDVPVTANGFATGGYPVNVILNHAPAPGTVLTLVNNTGLGFIHGTFANLSQGQRVTLAYDGVNYDFTANYYGGSGNDLVLQWADTKLMAWGSNSYGQLGDATTTRRLLPTAIDATGVLAGKTITAVAEGYLHSLALCSDGTLAAWGYNVYGQLGNDGAAPSSVPVAVDRSGVLASRTVIAIAAGPFHNLALCSDGTVVAWGYNNYGQLGTGDKATSRVPVVVNPLGALAGKQVVGVAAAAYHSFALCADGTLAAWGYNDEGELGDGTTTNSPVPVAVNLSGPLAGKQIAALSAGQYHTLALCTDSTLLAWGYNNRGQLGNDSTVSSTLPVDIGSSGVLAGKAVVSVRASGAHSLALCADGSLATWGWNKYGQLGLTGVAQSNVPVAIDVAGVSAGQAIAQIAMGGNHSLARFADGTLAAWGDNANGQLGNHTVTPGAVPGAVDLSGLSDGARCMMVASGSAAQHNLAVVALPVGSATSHTNGLQVSALTDSDHDGRPDLIEYAFGLHSDADGFGQLPQARREGDNLAIRFTQPAGVSGIIYGAEWSPSLLPGSWIEVPDGGEGDEHLFSVPLDSGPRVFLRLKVNGP